MTRRVWLLLALALSACSDAWQLRLPPWPADRWVVATLVGEGGVALEGWPRVKRPGETLSFELDADVVTRLLAFSFPRSMKEGRTWRAVA